MCDIFFIIGCVRSATTAYAKVLGSAENAEVYIEQEPKLLIESRELMKGNLPYPISVLRQAKEIPIQAVLKRGLKYGDKNASYMPFIPYLNAVWDSKIVFLVRDGRDVVRSLMDWHKFCHPIFCMQEDDDNSSVISPEQAIWDYSRLRPIPEDPAFDRWKQMDQFQKAAWHWANYNAMALDHLSKLDRPRWKLVDVTRACVETVEALFEFLGLTGFDRQKADEMLDARINRLSDGIKQGDRFPGWRNWTQEQHQIFDEFADDMMSRLGYGC